MKFERLRTKDETLKMSQGSQAQKTLARKDEIPRKTGIRWSEMNCLLYRNPCLDLRLGVMHNWFEGVLHQHFRFRWGFVMPSKHEKTQGNRLKRKLESEGKSG